MHNAHIRKQGSFMKIAGYIALLATLIAETAMAGGDYSLTVHLNGLKNAQGNVRIGLYSDSATFRKEAQALVVQQIAASPGTVDVRFADIPNGYYAIMAYHDEDANGELNRRFGMFPTEGYGLSNNPIISGPPSFSDSSFEVVGTTEISIDIRY
jgi:uncharacterized protein (DUF2141 family)